jgi:hypothetical protein
MSGRGFPITAAALCLLVALCANQVRAQSTGGSPYGTPSYLEFSDPKYAVAGTEPAAVITVVRTGEFRQPVSVQYASGDGTARAGLELLWAVPSAKRTLLSG